MLSPTEGGDTPGVFSGAGARMMEWSRPTLPQGDAHVTSVPPELLYVNVIIG